MASTSRVLVGCRVRPAEAVQSFTTLKPALAKARGSGSVRGGSAQHHEVVLVSHHLIRSALVGEPPDDDTVMVGEGRPSTFFLALISKVVDGGPSPAMTVRAPIRGRPPEHSVPGMPGPAPRHGDRPPPSAREQALCRPYGPAGGLSGSCRNRLSDRRDPARGWTCGLLSLAPFPCNLPRRSLHFTCFAFRALCFQPPRRSPDRFNTHFSASSASRVCAGLGFATPSHRSSARGQAPARHTARPNRVCHPPLSQGQALRIARSPRVAPPPRLAADAVTSGFRFGRFTWVGLSPP